MAPPLAPIYNWAKAEKKLLENGDSPTQQRLIVVARNHIKLAFDKGYSEHVLIEQAERMRHAAEVDWIDINVQKSNETDAVTMHELKRVQLRLRFFTTMAKQIDDCISVLTEEEKAKKDGYVLVRDRSEFAWEVL